MDPFDVLVWMTVSAQTFFIRFLSGIGAALAGSMANKSSIVIDLRGWRTPSVSGEEPQALGKSGPRYTAEIARGLPVPGAEQSARVRPSGKTSAKVQAAFHECSWFVAL